ncbi:MAG: HEAT repeat domain-containing protein [Cyanobacteria bacterium K_DeepCast_35m_m1_288]|nr:HEAT repeat domain-containing protein [Cyanobacteria bacterium K_DeepCast_35m_m1_288]
MNFEALREAIASGNPGRARPALASLVEATPEQAEPLLLLGLQQEGDMLLRQLSCSGLGHKPTPAGWEPLVHTLEHDPEVAVRAEAANALVSHGLQRAWPLLLAAFERDQEWILRCSVLSAVAEHPDALPEPLLQLAQLAIADGDGTVRVGGAEILGRLVREEPAVAAQARAELARLQHDADHRVVAAALNGLQG